jgi:hypothetical protein
MAIKQEEDDYPSETEISDDGRSQQVSGSKGTKMREEREAEEGSSEDAVGKVDV